MSPQSVPRQRGSEKEHRTAVERVVIMGAAGRDFHTFNTYFRDNPAYEVVAFTAAQIPGIADRHYPPVLSGARYPQGIPIGSVACKVEAAIEFLRGGGQWVLIGLPEELLQLLRGEAGTELVP